MHPPGIFINQKCTWIGFRFLFQSLCSFFSISVFTHWWYVFSRNRPNTPAFFQWIYVDFYPPLKVPTIGTRASELDHRAMLEGGLVWRITLSFHLVEGTCVLLESGYSSVVEYLIAYSVVPGSYPVIPWMDWWSELHSIALIYSWK